MLQLINKHGGNPFDDVDLALLRDLCEQISSAVYQCRVFHSEKENARAEAITAGKMSEELKEARQNVDRLVVEEERQKKLLDFSAGVCRERSYETFQ